MATTFRWTGTTSGAWGTTTNWNPNGTVATGDTVKCGAEATQGISSGLDRTGDAYPGGLFGLNLALFEIEDGFNFNNGSSSTPLKLTADKFVDRGGGELYFTSLSGTAAQPTDLLIIDKSDIGRMVTIGVGATITRMDILRGANVSIDGNTAQITKLYVVPRTGPFDVDLTIQGNPQIATFFMGGGNVLSSFGTFADIHVGGGALDLDGDISNASTITGNLIQWGGLVRHNMGDYTAFGANSIYYGFGGYMDSTQTPGTKGIITMIRAPYFEYARNPKLTITTETILGD